jgi:ABC-type nitrate/sulfonate/bicarbonate transport system substrate-binding protein
MAIIAKKDARIASIKELKGKRVAVFPGTTQEVFFLEPLRMEGMTIKDVEPVRVSFSEMHSAVARRHRRVCRRRARPWPVEWYRLAGSNTIFDGDGIAEHGVGAPIAT